VLSTVVSWAQATDHACFNSTEDYWVTATIGSTYGWVLSGGGTITPGSTTDKIKVNWTGTAGPYTLTVIETITSTNCTGEPKVLTITVDPLATPTFILGDIVACLNSTGNIYSTQTGMTNYAWLVTGGTITAGGGILDPTVTITWPTAGPQSVTVNYANAGCSAAAPKLRDVTVNPLPVTSPIYHN